MNFISVLMLLVVSTVSACSSSTYKQKAIQTPLEDEVLLCQEGAIQKNKLTYIKACEKIITLLNEQQKISVDNKESYFKLAMQQTNVVLEHIDVKKNPELLLWLYFPSPNSQDLLDCVTKLTNDKNLDTNLRIIKFARFLNVWTKTGAPDLSALVDFYNKMSEAEFQLPIYKNFFVYAIMLYGKIRFSEGTTNNSNRDTVTSPPVPPPPPAPKVKFVVPEPVEEKIEEL